MTRPNVSIDQFPITFRLRPLAIWAGLSALAFATASVAISGQSTSEHGALNLIVFWVYWEAVAWFGFGAIVENKDSSLNKANIGRFVVASFGVTALGVLYATVLIVGHQALSNFVLAFNDKAGFISSALVATAAFFSLLWHGQVLLEIAAGAKATLRDVSKQATRLLPGISICAIGLGTLSSIADHEFSTRFSDSIGVSDVVHWVLGLLSIVLTGWFRTRVIQNS